MKSTRHLLSSALVLLVLAGCSNKDPSGSRAPHDGGPTAQAVKLNSPLSPARVDLVFELEGNPVYDAGNDSVAIKVAVTNKGATPLATAGTHPVQLGLVVRDPDGGMQGAVARQDFVRIPIPGVLEPGATAVIAATFPAAPAIGGTVVVDAVQEGVSWFSSYGKQTLEVGRFQRCHGSSQTLCLANGNEVPAAN